MKQRRIKATLTVTALVFTTLLVFAALSLASMTAVQPMQAASAQNVKHMGQIGGAGPPTSTGAWIPTSVDADVTTYNTLRVHGGPGWPNLPGNMGAGSGVVSDQITGLLAEDQPYTEPLSVFNPQLAQAPRNDSITWNPLWMSGLETFDENWAEGLYGEIRSSWGLDASEKVWFRLWYEPEHWDKDLNASRDLDRDASGQPVAPVNPSPTTIDEWYPAIMQEFTYLLMEPGLLADKPEPVAGQVGQASFVFPVGMRYEDLFDTYGYGLTSLDANFDGTPDIVHVESELTLFNETNIAADFDGDGVIDPLDTDGIQLSGDELAVFRLDNMFVLVGGYIQFLDHLVRLDSVFDSGVAVEIFYTGDLVPRSLGLQFLGVGNMALAGTAGPPQFIEAVSNGGPGTNMCNFPTGTFFVYLDFVDPAEEAAVLMVGRALGATYSSMEDTSGWPDRRPGDPWFLKRFYVDGHEYNAVAIETKGYDTPYANRCDLDDNDDGQIDVPPWEDTTGFQFITIRTPIPKVSVVIEQHSVNLQDYAPEDWLSVMPPYNYEHYVIEDVQAITAFDVSEGTVDYFGKLVGPVPPILQKNGPLPYVGAGPYSPYDAESEMYLTYVEEDKNPQFVGELKEKYGDNEEEFWYVEQWRTRPWEYTEFVLPDIREDITGPGTPDLYLLTSAFTAPQARYVQWLQDVSTPLRHNASENTMPSGWRPRVKLWFDPAMGGKAYKDENGLRIYGFQNEGAGTDFTTDKEDASYPVEVLPYTDPWAPFNPQLPEAPRRDSLTFNPAYMDAFQHGGEPLADLYNRIAIEEHDAREKVFFRAWYEPEYLDKVLEGSSTAYTETYTFPAVMQEFTYMYLDTLDQPSHGQPGNSQFAFPIGTTADELPAPDPVTGDLPPARLPSFGYGLTTFDADFDGSHDVVTIHSEETISETLGIGIDFDGNGSIDQLDIDGVELSGDELVVFAVEHISLGQGDSAMFLDHMVTLDNVTASDADFKIWYAGGGLHPPEYSLHPDHQGTEFLGVNEIALVYKNSIRTRSQGQNTLGWPGGPWGPWFVYVHAINQTQEMAIVTIGRALGATHSAIDDGAGYHDLLPGDPWWLKRFFVDGHEYNVVAIKTVPADGLGEDFEFQYITIRTPQPKVNFINQQDSQKLEGYHLGIVHGVDTNVISVMPPFNFNHTRLKDIQQLQEGQFANSSFYVEGCAGDLQGNVPPLQIRIVDEDTEEQFFGELKENYWEYLDEEIWSTEQFHTLPDQYTDLQLPAGQLYLLTSHWESDQGWVHYYGCNPTDGYFDQNELHGWNPSIPLTNTMLSGLDGFFAADLANPLRVKFWYDPEDSEDIYVNTWEPPPFSCDTVTEIPQAECEALAALYNSTDGANWSDNSGWMNTNTPCNWYGVICSAGNVTGLSLGYNQLGGSIPPQLGNLTNLQDLYLSGNQLNGNIPPEFGNLANLQYLSLHINQLSGSIPPQLGGLANLQVLWLHSNRLSGSVPTWLGNLVDLRSLSLHSNQLSGSIPPELGNLINLQDLYLSNNQLSGSIPPDLGNLTNLQNLHLSDNQLSGSITPQLGNLASLQGLYLHSNQLSGSIPTWLGNLSDLKYLYLYSNQLGGGIPPELGNLTSLEVLYLDWNQLSGSMPPELGNLANLQSLTLSGNQLSGGIPLELGNLVDLLVLWLNDNHFSGALPGTLTNLTNLDTFWFHDTDLCEPADTAFQNWLAGISDLSSTGVICPGPGLPYTVTLVAYPTSLTVGNTLSLTATVKDQYDNNVPDGTAVLFETSLGSLGSVTVTKTTVSGVVAASLTSQVVGTAVVTATSDSVCDTTNVAFYPGPPHTVTLQANPTSISVGGFTSTLRSTVTDQFNNNVADGTIVIFTTSLGEVGSTVVTKTTSSGVATAVLTSGDTAGTAIITAMSDSVIATTAVDITAGTRIQIPRIDKEVGWDTRIQIQNVGDGPTGVITFFWEDYSTTCPPSAPGPVAHLCHRIPGSWGAQAVQADIPATAESAILYSVSDDLYEAACEAAGNYGAWLNWEDTYAYSGEPLAVTVNRRASNGSLVSGTYNGFSETMSGPGPYRYFAPYITHGYDNFDSTITIQNSGDLCTSIWLYYKEERNCEYMKAQHIEQLAPGEAIRIGPGPDADTPYPGANPGDPGVAPWLGSTYVTAAAPLAVVVDRWDADSTMLLTHAGFPYVDHGATTNYAPLVYRDLAGWNAEIHVQNLTQNSEPTFVTVEFFDQSGDSILFVGDWICRNGTHTFDLLDIVDLGVNFPFGYVGAAEIQSHQQVDYPGQQHPGEPIASVVSLVNSDSGEALSYNAFTPQQVAGVTTFASPRVSKQSQATSRIVIRNNSNCNKITGKIWIWDGIGASVATIPMPWLHPKHIEIFDLAYFGQIAPGFVGAATFEVLEVEQLCDLDNDGYVDDEPIMPSVIVLNHGDSASGQEAFPIPGGVIISEVQVTNARDTSLTVSWLTNQTATGEVHYGADPATTSTGLSTSLDQIAYDDRGVGATDDTHYVTITDLSPSTTYYFDVVSDGTVDDNGGAHYSVTTGPTLGLPGSDTIYGQVFQEDETTPAEAAIVYITLFDDDGSGSPDEAAPLSALVDDTGYWNTNLGNARTADLNAYFTYSANGDKVRLEAQGAADGTGCLLVDTADDGPAADLILNVSTCLTVDEIPLQLGWNHISLPLEPLTSYTAEGVCDEIISQGGDVTEVDRWYASGWDGHICGLPFNDFDIELGADYFIKSSAVSTWTIEGFQVIEPVSLSLQIGWNSIGLPHADGCTAEELCQEIISQGVAAVEIDRWYAGGWDGHVCDLPFNDFTIERGKGYFVKAVSAGVVTPTCPAPATLVSLLAVPQQASLADMEAQARVENVRITNLRDTSFVVSWTTDRVATGYLEFADGRVVHDVRGEGFAGETHYVIVTGLAPETTYHFDVHSGVIVDDNERVHYAVTTMPTLDILPDSDAVYGQVFLGDGVTPAEGVIVYLTLADRDGQGNPGEAAVMSALVDEHGWWQANLGNARLADGSGYFTYSVAGDAVVLMAQDPAGRFVSRMVDTGDLGSAAPLTLVRQRRPYLPLVVKE